MPMPSRTRGLSIRVLIWVLTSGVAVFVYPWRKPSSLFDGGFRSIGNIWLLHAQRVRSAVEDLSSFSEVDPQSVTSGTRD